MERKETNSEIYLLSTVVAPIFITSQLNIGELSQEELIVCLKSVKPGHNLCGHPVTSNLLKKLVPGLPDPVREFWKGDGIGIAVRPKNGVRASSTTGDTLLNGLSELEWVSVTFRKFDRE